MKKSIIFICLFFLSMPLMAHESSSSFLQYADQKIHAAMGKSLKSKSDAPLREIISTLKTLESQEPSRWITYLLGFAQYYQVAWLHSTEMPENIKMAESLVKDTLAMLDGLQDKTAEEYALLSLVQSISIKFVSKLSQRASLSGKTLKSIKKSLSMESDNLRANFSAGFHNYNTPKAYGGKKWVEKYLLKAVDLPDQKTANPYAPSWGKERVYEILIMYYIETNQKDRALQYLNDAVVAYPNSYSISVLASKVK